MRRSLLLFGLVLLLGAGVRAALAPGDRLPDARGRDLRGERHELRALAGDGPTLLVAITDRDAGDAMQAWFDVADVRAPRAARVSIISLRLPFFVSTDYARSKAREKVPRRWWSRTLFDKDGALADALRLGDGEEAWAFAIGPEARVLAAVHGSVNGPEAEKIWRALEAGGPSSPAPAGR